MADPTPATPAPYPVLMPDGSTWLILPQGWTATGQVIADLLPMAELTGGETLVGVQDGKARRVDVAVLRADAVDHVQGLSEDAEEAAGAAAGSAEAAAGSAGAANTSAGHAAASEGAAAGSAGAASGSAAAADLARGNAATAAGQAQAALAAFLLQRYGTVLVTGALSLTLAEHNNRLLQVSGSGGIAVPWVSTGGGFSCLILNQRALPLAIVVSGTALSHPDGHTKVRAGGLAALIGTEGAPGVLQLVGQTEP